MIPIDQQLKDRIVSLPDVALLRILESHTELYTPEAIAFATEEIEKRGGIEVLKQKVESSKSMKSVSRGQEEHPSKESPESEEILVKLKILYPLFVLVAYGLFVYVFDASFWFYWLCLFSFFGSLFAVLFMRRETKWEEESKEIAGGMARESDTPPSVPTSTNDS
jgi:hypothetical protein